MAKAREVIEKKEKLKKENEEKAKRIIDNFSTSLCQLVEDEKKEFFKKNGYSIPQKQMYEKMGMGKTTFQNYKKPFKTGGKIPKNYELVKIHDYFNVSYSYLFGESTMKSTDEERIEIGAKFGLNDKSVGILENYKKRANSETIEDNFESSTKLFLINALISNDKLLSRLVHYFSISLGRNIEDKKYSKFKIYKPFKNDESIYSMTKYAIMTDFIEFIDNLTKGEEVPIKIKNNAESYADKYAGKMQSVIRSLNDK